jgi:hypothetical protein
MASSLWVRPSFYLRHYMHYTVCSKSKLSSIRLRKCGLNIGITLNQVRFDCIRTEGIIWVVPNGATIAIILSEIFFKTLQCSDNRKINANKLISLTRYEYATKWRYSPSTTPRIQKSIEEYDVTTKLFQDCSYILEERNQVVKSLSTLVYFSFYQNDKTNWADFCTSQRV